MQSTVACSHALGQEKRQPEQQRQQHYQGYKQALAASDKWHCHGCAASGPHQKPLNSRQRGPKWQQQPGHKRSTCMRTHSWLILRSLAPSAAPAKPHGVFSKSKHQKLRQEWRPHVRGGQTRLSPSAHSPRLSPGISSKYFKIPSQWLNAGFVNPSLFGRAHLQKPRQPEPAGNAV